MDAVPERQRILVVDDYDGMRVLLAVMIQRLGYEPVTVPNAAAAWETLTTGPYVAVIADWEMPGEDGLALLRRVRARGDRIPFVLMSGSLPDEIARNALRSGADLAIDKREAIESLPSVLAQALGAPSRRSAARRARRSVRRPSPSLAR